MKKLILLLLILIFPIMINAAQVCGDGNCRGTETCSTCPADCGACPPSDGETTTTISSGGGGVQSVIGIFPREPLGGDSVFYGILQLKTEIFYAGKPINSMNVKANSSMFGEVVLKHEKSFPDGVYIANVTIDKNTKLGQKRIVYTAGGTEQYNEASFLVDLKPNLEIVTDLRKIYYKGGAMIFKGTVFNKEKEPEQNTTVQISSYKDKNKIFSISAISDEKGNFYSEYLIKHGDPEGIWEITIDAESREKEFGTKSLFTQVNVPENFLYYSVNFLSPLKEKSFRRGEIIPITIEVKENNEFVKGASAIVYTPLDEKIILKETADGKYSGNYVIKPNDPIDNWFLKTEIKNTIGDSTKVGGASIPIIVGPTEIKFNVLSPVLDTLYTNSRLKIKIELTYPDESLVKGANLNAILSNGKTIPLLETSDGIYECSYFIETKDIGALNMKIEAEDINNNFGNLDKTIFIQKRSFIGNILTFIQEIIRQYWWAIFAFLIAAALIYKPSFEILWIKRKIQKSIEEQKNIKAMQKNAEGKYYKKGELTKKEFKDIMEKYEERLARANEDEKIYKKKLIKKLTDLKK